MMLRWSERDCFFFSDRDDVLFDSLMISVEIAIESWDVRKMLTEKLRNARKTIRKKVWSSEARSSWLRFLSSNLKRVSCWEKFETWDSLSRHDIQLGRWFGKSLKLWSMLEPIEISFSKRKWVIRWKKFWNQKLNPPPWHPSTHKSSLPKLEEEDDENFYDDVFTRAKSDVSFLPTEAWDFIFTKVEDATERTSCSKPGLLDILFLIDGCI